MDVDDGERVVVVRGGGGESRECLEDLLGVSDAFALLQ